MKSNVGKPDKNIRIVLGIIIVAAGLFQIMVGNSSDSTFGYCFYRVLPAIQIVLD